MAYKSDNPMFRDLSDSEEVEFRSAARKNYKGGPIDPLWHPVYREECAKVNSEANRGVPAPRSMPALAREAVMVQDASNLRGVLLSWHKALCEECVIRGGQAEEFLNILYLSKVTSLLVAKCDGIGDVAIQGGDGAKTDFRMAYEWAKTHT